MVWMWYTLLLIPSQNSKTAKDIAIIYMLFHVTQLLVMDEKAYFAKIFSNILIKPI